MRKNLLFAFFLLLFVQSAAFAQVSMFSAGLNNRSRRGDAPTTISSDAMDIDIAKNKATFLGNVIVDDPEMMITCRKMTIYLQDAAKPKTGSGKETPSDAAKTKPSASPEDSIASGKELDRIECKEDVVITRKQQSVPGAAREEQKALAGKAVYHFKGGTIVLTENPVIVKGKSRLRGEMITLHLDSERVEIVSGKIQSSDISRDMGTK